jgi:curved DNA-binding protein CbpA
METEDPYKVLGLSRDSSQDDIRKAHRKLVRKYHPDANPEDPRAEVRFKEVQQAYEVLPNEQKRREYDKGLRTSSRGRSGRPPRARPGGSTGRGAASTVDLSELWSKLADLSSARSDGRKESDFQLRGEDVAHVARLLGVDTSRVSELLGNDVARLVRLLGESIETNVKGSFGDARSGESSTANEYAERKMNEMARKMFERRNRG